MAIQKLVCSNCKGALKWNQEDRTFTCENCGTKFQTDNEFTYRIIDEANIKKQEVELEKQKVELEKQKAKALDDKWHWIIITALVLFLIFILLRETLI